MGSPSPRQRARSITSRSRPKTPVLASSASSDGRINPLSQCLSEQLGLFELGKMPRLCEEKFLCFGAVNSARSLVRAPMRLVSFAPNDQRRLLDWLEWWWRIREIALER
jgi:hypothetical protein